VSLFCLGAVGTDTPCRNAGAAYPRNSILETTYLSGVATHDALIPNF